MATMLLRHAHAAKVAAVALAGRRDDAGEGHCLIALVSKPPNALVELRNSGAVEKPLRPAPNVELQSGVLIQGTPYAAVYNNSDAAFYLYGVGTDPGIPLGSSIDYWGTSAPTSAFALAYGQAISRTTYAPLFSLFGTTYGNGDGSTTFNLPDLRGRVVAGKDDMGGSAASRLTSAYFGTSAATLGAVGGSQNHALTLSELPTGITSANASQAISITLQGKFPYVASNEGIASVPVPSTGGSYAVYNSGGTSWFAATSLSSNNSISVTSTNTSGNAHSIISPTIVANKLIRII
ncbi:tail fiber protein [Bradyrhizobium sp.]|uniref:phage tail protein n=1 Tax=Bradyrhizobium sp. TaxID=376 RepID=UPI00263614B4|nr:tail fiber protein [Bradyrhizobium sp.]